MSTSVIKRRSFIKKDMITLPALEAGTQNIQIEVPSYSDTITPTTISFVDPIYGNAFVAGNFWKSGSTLIIQAIRVTTPGRPSADIEVRGHIE